MKLANEIQVDKKIDSKPGSNGISEKSQEEEKEEKKKQENGEEPKKGDRKEEAHIGGKRKADENTDVGGEKNKTEVEGDDAKKQKTSNVTVAPANANGAVEKKKPGRPKGSANGDKLKKEKKVPVVGKAERKTRSQGTA